MTDANDGFLGVRKEKKEKRKGRDNWDQMLTLWRMWILCDILMRNL